VSRVVGWTQPLSPTGVPVHRALYALQVAAVKQPTMFNGSDNDKQISREKLEQFAAVLKDKAGVESDVKVRCRWNPNFCMNSFNWITRELSVQSLALTFSAGRGRPCCEHAHWCCVSKVIPRVSTAFPQIHLTEARTPAA